VNRLQKIQIVVSVVVAATAGLLILSSQLIQRILSSQTIQQSDWGIALIGFVFYLSLQAILFATLHAEEI
jgi:hypothetical protein